MEASLFLVSIYDLRERERKSGGAMESPTNSVCLCRICYEEEDENSTSMESPCGCSGSLKVIFPFLLLITFAIVPSRSSSPRRRLCEAWFRDWFGFPPVSVCSSRLHTEVVRWERKQFLWALQSGKEAIECFCPIFLPLSLLTLKRCWNFQDAYLPLNFLALFLVSVWFSSTKCTTTS